jgi:ribonuclease VapC
MFVDASALVAIMAQEEGWEAISDCLETSKSRRTSPIAVYEAGLAIARKRSVAAGQSAGDVLRFLELSGVKLIELSGQDGEAALIAHQRFGKGRHPAALNMGDCFAYACAKRLGVPLLYKGDDFSLTDIPSAMEHDS